MKLKLMLFTVMMVSPFLIEAQDLRKWELNDAGLEIQAYPAGLMFMAKANFNLTLKNQFTTKIGYNMARRQDFGEHDNEEGGGFGINVAFKHYFNQNYLGWNYSLRTSVWMLNIDWMNNSPSETGITSITVLQPTIAGGYDFALNSKLKIGLFIAFGYEVNIITSGQNVGQGGISLMGFSLTHQINR
jgi:hypothetical protein